MPKPLESEMHPRRPILLAGLFVAVFFGCCLLSLALPHDRYVRYQQLGFSSMSPGLWSYERTAFDKTPIDIALIGASRLQVGVSAPELGRELSAELGQPIHVANFAVPHEGRNFHYEMTRQLLATHPEVKLILFTITEHVRRASHPAFRNIADVGDVIRSPLLINRDYLSDVAYLPYRQISLFLQTQAPQWFGVRLTFDPARYRGTDFDSTHSDWTLDGRFIDRDSEHPAADLQRDTDRITSYRDPAVLPDTMVDYEYVVERHYMRAIVELAARHGVQIGFVYTPIYNYRGNIRYLDFYRSLGPVFRADELAFDHRNYSDYGHLNRNGSGKLTSSMARRLLQMERRSQIHLLSEQGKR